MIVTKYSFYAIFWSLIFLIFSSEKSYSQPSVLFKKKEYYSPQGDTCRYRIMSPDKFDPKQKYPLVVFFHGAGERGRDNEKQLIVGVHQFSTPVNRQKYPCFVLAPQCPMKTRWVQTEFGAPSHQMDSVPTRALGIAMETVFDFVKTHNVDTSRIYVLGISMGGFATWEVISRYPNFFAAAAPISGGGDELQALKIKHIPTWIFHGGQDKVVLTSRSQNMNTALLKAGGSPKYTEYAGFNHNCWGKCFSDPLLYSWMFGQKRK